MKFLSDFFLVLLLFVAYKLYGIYTATAVAIAASLIRVTGRYLAAEPAMRTRCDLANKGY